MSTIKVLVVGSVLGSFKSVCQKIKAIDQKHGKFEMVLASGDFFGPLDCSPVQKDELDALLNEQIEVPIQMYITQGRYPIPPPVVEKIQEHGQICKNVVLLSKSGILSTSHGLKIASLGGTYAPEKFYGKTSNASSLYQEDFTSSNLKQLIQQVSPSSSSNANSLAVAKAFASFQFIDILMTYTWPTSITSETATLPADIEPNIAPQLDELVCKTKPRYYFSSNGNKFWEREPFCWAEENNRTTRFINLGSFGDLSASQDSKKERWFYAFSIAPTQPSSSIQPAPPTASQNPFKQEDAPHKRPFEAAAERGDERPEKRSKKNGERNMNGEAPPDTYVCRICNIPGHYIRDCPEKKKNLNEIGTKKPPEGYACRACGSDQHYIKDCPIAQSGPREREHPKQRFKEIQPEECWFCLSNPNLAKHLLVAIGKECYITLPKGQIPPTDPDSSSGSSISPVPGGGHVLIVPISHFPTMPSIPSDLAPPILTEISEFQSALRSFYAAHNAVPITFEVSRLTAKGGHAHLQAVPLPKRIKDRDIEGAFEQAGIEWESATNADSQDSNLQSYFRVELPSGKNLIHYTKPGASFDVQFGRRIIANLLGLPERADWRTCAQSEDDERKDAEAFKQAFAAFDPSNF